MAGHYYTTELVKDTDSDEECVTRYLGSIPHDTFASQRMSKISPKDGEDVSGEHTAWIQLPPACVRWKIMETFFVTP